MKPLLVLLALLWTVPAIAGGVRATTDAGHRRLAGADMLDERVYIVQLAEPAALAYRGGTAGLAATRPEHGIRLDPDDAAVREYTERLTATHDALLTSVGAYNSKLYSYRYTFNGFAARMTEAQAQKLRMRKNVVRVWPDQVRYLQTNDSPAFLGLLDQNGGLRTDLGLDGENVIIGIIDSGIRPEHPSFDDSREADRPRLCKSTWSETTLLGLWLCARFRNRDDVLLYEAPAGWRGTCETGENFDTGDCNNKIIGARYYIDGFLAEHALDPNEFMSARDADGHGTHIASTAAGNDVRASIAGTFLDRISGMAPRARIAVYKACWLEPGQLRGSCATSDLQRAIEDAVADGVDIINYSVGNTDISISDPDDLALLTASDAGVLPVVAAGNDGAHADGNILSPSGAPWVLTVGASSRTGEKFEEAIRVDAPDSIADEYESREAAFTPELSKAGPISAELILVDDGSGVSFDACETIDNASELADQIAFIERGTCDFEVKLQNAEEAGAAAAVVFDNRGDLIIMAGTRGSVDIPAVMIGQADGQLLLTRLEAGDVVEVTLDKRIFITRDSAGDMIASFSSTGPNLTALDILKPDVAAPGVDILAGQTPEVANGVQGENFQYLSGTSMSVPHVAGLAALIVQYLRQQGREWSPAAIKSALMTTARQNLTKPDGETPADPFDFGAGHVVPNRAIDPGLVYDAGREDYDAFLCGAGMPRIDAKACDELSAAPGVSTLATDLNLPSIAVAGLARERQVRRRVTNVGSEMAQYRVDIDPPPGIDMRVSPQTLTLGAGDTAEFEVLLTGNGAVADTWQFGSLSWNDGTHAVRSPVAVRPVALVAPLQVAGSGTTGTLSFDIEFGYTGTYVGTVHGLVPANVKHGVIEEDDPANAYEFVGDDAQVPLDTERFLIDVPANQAYLRIALFDEDTDGDDDLDMYVYRCINLGALCQLIAVSGAFDSNEQVDILFPASGEEAYLVDVHGFETDPVVGGPGADFDLSVWFVGADDDRGNLAVTGPNAAIAGATSTITASWSNLDDVRWLGGISHVNDPAFFASEVLSPDDPRFLEFTTLEINY